MGEYKSPVFCLIWQRSPWHFPLIRIHQLQSPWAWWLGWWRVSGRDKTWYSEPGNQEKVFLWCNCNFILNLWLAQQVLSLPVFPLYLCFAQHTDCRDLGEAGFKWDSPILIIACVSPVWPALNIPQHSGVRVWCLCMFFVFISAGHCKETPGDGAGTIRQPAKRVCHCITLDQNILLRLGTLNRKHWPLNG